MQEENRRLVALAVLAALALVATGVAVAKSNDWTGERRYRFTATTIELEAQSMPAGSAPARFEWIAPANATGVHVNATISFAGQAVQGGSAVIRIRIVAPDGTNLPSVTRALAIGAGQSSASITIDHAADWAPIPESVRDNRQPMGYVWTGPLQIFVTVDPPADLPVASYAFTASLNCTVAAFVA